jgi:acyl-CoA thioester hydrolase
MNRYPAPPPHATTVEVFIPFHHVDLLRVAWHGHYLVYVDAARAEYLRRRRLDLGDLEELGFAFMVAESHVRHVHPLRYGQTVRVACWVTADENRIEMAYDLWNATEGRRSATARSTLVTVAVDGALCLETPAAIVARLRAGTREGP